MDHQALSSYQQSGLLRVSLPSLLLILLPEDFLQLEEKTWAQTITLAPLVLINAIGNRWALTYNGNRLHFKHFFLNGGALVFRLRSTRARSTVLVLRQVQTECARLPRFQNKSADRLDMMGSS